MSDQRYRTIVADPPWDHSDGTGYNITHGYGSTRRQRPDGGIVTAPPYGFLPLDAIMALPVDTLAEQEAHLYLWVTNRHLPHVWDVADAWGFEGVRLLVWCKSPAGVRVGGAWPSTAEFCLYAKRGGLPALSQAQSQWFHLPRRYGPPVAVGQRRSVMHSAKPEGFLDMVEQVSPAPYLELFARRQRLGWHTWGDEALQHVDLDGSAA